MKEIRTWAVVCDNLEGDYQVYYFENFDSASKSFDALVEKHKDCDEFENDHYIASWFDGEYNEYSTYIRLVKTTICLFNEMIEI